jgi:hypothetical protein
VFRHLNSDSELKPVDQATYFECFRANKFDKYNLQLESGDMPSTQDVLDFVTGLRQTREEAKLKPEQRMTHQESEIVELTQ